jgi:hypothetical protein
MPTIASLLKKYLRELVGTDVPPKIPLFTKELQEEVCFVFRSWVISKF